MIDYKISPGTAGNSDLPQRYDDLPSHNIEVFQSENIQNILDAKSHKKECVEIHYELTKLNSLARSNLKSLLGNKFFEKLKLSFDKCEAQDIEDQVKRVKLAFGNEDKWYALTITEKNTTGLLGDETGREKGSNYHALMRHNNKSEKEEVSGGTFGKGSSVYTYSSGLWLWFAYSVLETAWEETKVRFIGRGMIAPFTDREGNQSFDGPLWYSRREKKNDYINGYPQQGLPYINQAAHNEAIKFGLKRREENDPGTTYFIPVFWPDGISKDEMCADTILLQLKHEIIKRWFVPIYNEQLKCNIKISDTESDVVIEKRDLYTIPELRYKLEILDWYNNGAENSDKRFLQKKIEVKLPILTKSQQIKLSNKYGKKIGHQSHKVYIDLVARVLNDDDDNFKGFLDDEKIGTINRVALIRNKGMIINHYPYHTKSKEDLIKITDEKRFEAILFAGKMCKIKHKDEETNHLEMFLSFAENPAHNEWIHNSNDLHRCNLKRFQERPVPYPVSRVGSIFNSIYRIIAEFFPKDDNPPVKKEICSFWRQLYKLPAAGDRGGGEARYSYETIQEGFNSDGQYSWRLKVRSLNTEKRVKLTFNHYLSSLEGPVQSKEEYAKLGVPEFEELNIYEDGKQTKEVILEYDIFSEAGIDKELEIMTCKVTGNNLFKNMNPVLEIKDTTL